MGGFGSGSSMRKGKTTVDSQHAVDIRYMNKQGLLRPGGYGSLSWSCRGQQTGSIQYRIEEAGIRLMYKVRNCPSEDWTEVDQYVAFDYTPCHYGGKRTWLLCPRCNKRVTCIYGVGTHFLCRHCYNLNYQSQHEDYYDRQLTKAQDIRRKLGGHPGISDSFPPKPKYMHWKTYSQLYYKTKQGERVFMEKSVKVLEKLNRTIFK